MNNTNFMNEENKETYTNISNSSLGVGGLSKSTLDVDYIVLTDDEKIELERLSALGYSVPEMAMYFNKPLNEFKHDASTDGCIVNYHISRGKLIIKANAAMKLMELAESGNLTATQQLAKVVKDQEFKELLRQQNDDEF